MALPPVLIGTLAISLASYWLYSPATPVLLVLSIGISLWLWRESQNKSRGEKPAKAPKGKNKKESNEDAEFCQHLLSDVLEQLNQQVGIINSDLGQLKGILGDATGSLSNTVLSVDSSTNNQREALEKLVEELKNATGMEVRTSHEEESCIKRYTTVTQKAEFAHIDKRFQIKNT